MSRADLGVVLAAFAFTLCSRQAIASSSTLRHAIEIEFPTELELSMADHAPVPLRARWVRGETSDVVPGPLLRAWVNFGTVSDWKEDKGLWSGVWEPPKPAVPGQLALVISAMANGRAESSAQQTPVSAEIDLPGHSEAGAQVTLLVAGEKFGPVPAGPDGRFKVRVRVPPGVETAVAQSRDKLGNTFKRTVPLFVPKVSPLALVCPVAVIAAGESLPVSVATDIARAGGIAWSASDGKVALGVWHAPQQLARAPSLDRQTVTLTATSAVLGSNSCSVEVEPAPAASVKVALDPPFLAADGVASGRLLATVNDRFGNATRDSEVAVVEDRDPPLGLSYDAATRAFVGPLRSRKGVEQRTLLVTAAAANKTAITQSLVIEQIPLRGVALHAQRVGQEIELTVTPPGAAAEVRAVDDQGADIALIASARAGVLTTKALVGVRFVSFTHLPSGVSVLFQMAVD